MVSFTGDGYQLEEFLASQLTRLCFPRTIDVRFYTLHTPFLLDSHLAKKQTARPVMKCFYWPTLFKDADDFCRSCEECQKYTQRQGPMPPVTTSFERIAINIVGPLPCSRSGNRYVLVMCDYGTPYPEALPLKSKEAE